MGELGPDFTLPVPSACYAALATQMVALAPLQPAAPGQPSEPRAAPRRGPPARRAAAYDSDDEGEDASPASAPSDFSGQAGPSIDALLGADVAEPEQAARQPSGSALRAASALPSGPERSEIEGLVELEFYY